MKLKLGLVSQHIRTKLHSDLSNLSHASDLKANFGYYIFQTITDNSELLLS